MSTPRKKILIVGRDPEAVERVRAAAKPLGEAMSVENCNAALDAAASLAPDVVVLIPNRQHFEAQIFLKLLPLNCASAPRVLVVGKAGQYPNALRSAEVSGVVEEIENAHLLGSALVALLEGRRIEQPHAAFPLRAISNPPQAHHILIADDERDFLMGLKELLEGEGHRVTPLHDGHCVLPQLQGDRPDLIALDVMMPHLGGLHVCQLLKRHRELQDIPVLIMTARNGADEERIACEAGGDAFLRKPFSHADFLKTVGQLLSRDAHAAHGHATAAPTLALSS